jgi:hypothetical protein
VKKFKGGIILTVVSFTEPIIIDTEQSLLKTTTTFAHLQIFTFAL